MLLMYSLRTPMVVNQIPTSIWKARRELVRADTNQSLLSLIFIIATSWGSPSSQCSGPRNVSHGVASTRLSSYSKAIPQVEYPTWLSKKKVP